MSDVVWPRNDGNLPLDIERDEYGEIVRVRIAWRGFTIRQQFPWTRP
jgi:hypothetical protein